MLFIGFMIVIILVFIGILVNDKASQESERNEEIRKQELNKFKLWLKENKFEKTSELNFYNGYVRYSIFIDEINKKMLLINDLARKKEILEFKNIIGIEIIEDGISSNGIGRAVVGGALFGGVGAIVGSSTGKKTVSHMKAVIYTNSISNPQKEITLNTIKIKTDSNIYRNTMDFARKLDATVRAIVAQNENPA